MSKVEKMSKVEEPFEKLLQVSAAVAEALQRFEKLALSALKGSLDSKRNLERAQQATSEAVACQQKLSELVQSFTQTLALASEQNQRSAASLVQRSEEIQTSMRAYQELANQFAELGDEAVQISQMAARIGVEKAQRGYEALPELAEIEGRMSQVLDRAQELSQACRQGNWDDLVSQVGSLQQQMQSARNKVRLLRQRLAGTVESAPN